MQKASHARHPRDLLRCIPAELKESIDFQENSSPAEVAKARTESMRRWVLRAKELRDLGEDLPMNDRCRRILGSKSVKLFSYMLGASVTALNKFAKTLQTVSSSWDPCHVQVAHLEQKAAWAAVADCGREVNRRPS